MEITPNFRATRFSQLRPGELFLFRDGSAFAIALTAMDAVEEERVMIPLGPAQEKAGRLIQGSQENLLSLGTEYELRLPCHPSGWSAKAPPPDRLCFLLSAHAGQPSGQSVYLRAMFGAPEAGFRFCYVDIKTGGILTISDAQPSPYVTPGGICGYAIEWSLLTKETEPRVILSYPVPNRSEVTGSNG